MNFCRNFLCLLIKCCVPQRSRTTICVGTENCRKKFFNNFSQCFRNLSTQIKILKFEVAFSSKNFEIGNLARWNQILATPFLCRTSVGIKNSRWSKKSDKILTPHSFTIILSCYFQYNFNVWMHIPEHSLVFKNFPLVVKKAYLGASRKRMLLLEHTIGVK
jgi:hypothetical protein